MAAAGTGLVPGVVAVAVVGQDAPLADAQPVNDGLAAALLPSTQSFGSLPVLHTLLPVTRDSSNE